MDTSIEYKCLHLTTVSLLHTGRCPLEVNGGILWQRTLQDSVVSKQCHEAGPVFRSGPEATRRCNETGEWEEADLTSCTLDEVEEPFLLVWFVIEADRFTGAMEEEFVSSVRHQYHIVV